MFALDECKDLKEALSCHIIGFREPGQATQPLTHPWHQGSAGLVLKDSSGNSVNKWTSNSPPMITSPSWCIPVRLNCSRSWQRSGVSELELRMGESSVAADTVQASKRRIEETHMSALCLPPSLCSQLFYGEGCAFSVCHLILN